MTTNNQNAPVVVMGAGIMGCCLALELARRNVKVDLIDMAPTPMTAASLHNEGKLHLGFVYANDPNNETYKVMLEGSLTFFEILKQLTRCGIEDLLITQPFHYFIPRDSQLSVKEIQDHFSEVDRAAKNLSESSGHLYLDQKFSSYFEENSEETHQSLFSPAETLGSFKTEERSVSPRAVADILIQSIQENGLINFIGATKVESAVRCSDDSVTLELERDRNKFTKKYACAINCLWEDKLRIDDTVGIDDNKSWLYRYKATLDLHIPSLARKGASIPSATGILGSYGDVVNHGNGDFYISWYPLCKLAQLSNRRGSDLHDMVHKRSLAAFVKLLKTYVPNQAKRLTSYTHKRFVGRNIREMARYIPAMSSFFGEEMTFTVGGGVILALGATDIDDPSSHLHQRSAIGPRSYDSYITIDTGKYCTAPMFALTAADMVVDRLH